MRTIKRDLLYGSAMSVVVLTFALSWGGPFLKSSPANAQDQANPPQQQKDQAKSKTFTGTIVRSGEEFLLRDSAGLMYKLDDSEHAKQFEGKPVKVTGQLDQQAMVIHVEAIEGANA